MSSLCNSWPQNSDQSPSHPQLGRDLSSSALVIKQSLLVICRSPCSSSNSSPLEVSPLMCQLSSGLMKEMLTTELSFNPVKTVLVPFLPTWFFFCVFTVRLCLMLTSVLCSNMLLNVHALCAEVLLSTVSWTEEESVFLNHLPPLKLTYLNCNTLQLIQSGVLLFKDTGSERQWEKSPKKHWAHLVNWTVLSRHPTVPPPHKLHLNSLCC